MYAVVGCSDCQALWIVEGRPETTQCPRCGSTRQHAKRRKFVETDDEDHAREVRASMLAARQDQGDAFAKLDSFAEMEAQLDDAGPNEDAVLEAAGVDPDEASAAGERATSGAGGSTSRKETVLAALRESEEPTAEDIVAYATERGVPESYVRNALEKLQRRGEVTESGGTYRRL
jgi:DNA replicative helicase MCM subunit Mcm2 (Cdc46/Mcm family)